MVDLCPLCGCEVAIPIMFNSIKMQRMFAYIWDNPNCVAMEIHKQVAPDQSLVSTLNMIKRIEHMLGWNSSPYRFIRSTDPAHVGSRRFRFKIILKPSAQSKPTEGITNGTV